MIERIFRIFALGMLLTLAACDETVVMIGEARHPTGLVVPQPEALQVGQDSHRLVFSDPRGLRRPLSISFTISDEEPPEAATSVLLDFSGVRSLIEEQSGGSGGAEYRLRAWRPVGQRWIVMTAEKQNEGWAPSFAVAWEMIKGARIED